MRTGARAKSAACEADATRRVRACSAAAAMTRETESEEEEEEEEVEEEEEERGAQWRQRSVEPVRSSGEAHRAHLTREKKHREMANTKEKIDDEEGRMEGSGGGRGRDREMERREGRVHRSAMRSVVTRRRRAPKQRNVRQSRSRGAEGDREESERHR